MLQFKSLGAPQKENIRRLAVAMVLFAGLCVLIQLRTNQDADHFDQTAFSSNLLGWINGQVEEEGAKIKAVHILERRKQDAAGLPLFFTRVALEPVKGGLVYVSYLTDNTGRNIYNSVIDLERKVDVSMLARIENQPKATLPQDLGVILFSGDGPHRVVMFADFFCGHCDKAERWLLDNAVTLGIGRVEIIPAPMHPLSGQVLDNLLAKSKESRQAFYLEHISGLPERKLDQKQLEDLFPHGVSLDVEARQQKTGIENAIKDFQVKGTPVMYVDGLALPPGFNPNLIKTVLRGEK